MRCSASDSLGSPSLRKILLDIRGSRHTFNATFCTAVWSLGHKGKLVHIRTLQFAQLQQILLGCQGKSVHVRAPRFALQLGNITWTSGDGKPHSNATASLHSCRAALSMRENAISVASGNRRWRARQQPASSSTLPNLIKLRTISYKGVGTISLQ